jgi:GDP/UDP-N,N'-diacetylbacillosamine 2-epimerase (hydrolysing)
MKKICVVSGTRAEYGLLRWVIEGIKNSPLLELQLIVTGMHLSPEFGLTVREIESDGFSINRRVEMLLSSDTTVGVTKSIGLGLIGFADALHEMQPDMLLVLGDRYEILAAATAAMIGRIPIAHLHGGEATEGLIDEPIRHSVTKMSHLHFVAAEEYRRRVIQLGEEPKRVFLVGGLGIDNIKKLKFLGRNALEESLNIKFRMRNLLITFHPVTLEVNSSKKQMEELLFALDRLEDTQLIFTMPNADTDGRVLFELIESFVANHKNSYVFASMGQLRYLSCLAQVDAVLGNSSSGLTEVPSFKKATINIGDRQRGRLKATSVIDCNPDRDSIYQAIQQVYTENFQASLGTVLNPYGQGGASAAIIDVLEKTSLENIIIKPFHDLAVL